jgi:Uma2 family endonuclease
MATIIIEESLEVPDGIRDLAEFRTWALSDSFPQRGRIDFINGCIEIDMSPEALYSHGNLKVELVRVLAQLVKDAQRGDLFSDRTRISSPAGNVSAEPDIVFLSHESVRSGRVRLVPKSASEFADYVEVEGPPDFVAEIVSDSSVSKDKKRLPEAYFKAGVTEFWLIDARRKRLVFEIHRRGKSGFEQQKLDDEGYQQSLIFDRRFKLNRRVGLLGQWQYDLLHEPLR